MHRSSGREAGSTRNKQDKEDREERRKKEAALTSTGISMKETSVVPNERQVCRHIVEAQKVPVCQLLGHGAQVHALRHCLLVAVRVEDGGPRERERGGGEKGKE